MAGQSVGENGRVLGTHKSGVCMDMYQQDGTFWLRIAIWELDHLFIKEGLARMGVSSYFVTLLVRLAWSKTSLGAYGQWTMTGRSFHGLA